MDHASQSRSTGRATVGKRLRTAAGAVLTCLGICLAAALTGCKDDSGSRSNNGGPLGGGTTPEAFIASMAESLLSHIAGDEIDSLLFPADHIDYETLMQHFLDATKQLLDEQTITEQDGYVNGELANLNELEVRFNAIPDPSKDPIGVNDIYNQLLDEEGDVNETLGVLEQYPGQALGGWMSGAQVKLSYLGLEIELNAVRNPTNSAVQSDLAYTLDSFIDYAVDTRNDVLYQGVLNSVQKITACESGDPCEETDCSYSYKDCSGTTHKYYWYDYDKPKSDCDDARIQEIEDCADSTYGSMADQLGWMESTLETWRQSLSGMAAQVAAADQPCAVCADALSTIVVEQMTYKTDSSGDVSSQERDGTSWLAAACNDRYTCDFKLSRDDFDVSGNFALFEASYHCANDSRQRTISISGAGNPALAEGAVVHIDCAPRLSDFQILFRGETLPIGVDDVDVSSNKSPGVDASKLVDGVTAPTGHSYNDPQYALVYPGTGSEYAIIVDTGQVQTMGDYPNYNSYFQGAGSAKTYRCEYSTDGINWTLWGDFVTYGASGLQSATQDLKKVSARYVRVWLITNAAGSASELRISAADGSNALLHKPAYFVGPKVNDGIFAPEGSSTGNTDYATKLTSSTVSGALMFDMGKVYNSLDRVKVQADANDVYKVEVSTDNLTWFPWYTADTVSGSGLRTRDSGQLPQVSGRYVRIYALSDDTSYYVSEVQVFANRQVPSCDNQQVCAVSVGDQLYTLLGSPPTAQDAADVVATWICGGQPFDAQGVPWSGSPSFDPAVVQAHCTPQSDACSANHPLTCSQFATDADDDTVYANARAYTGQMCLSEFASCPDLIASLVASYENDTTIPATNTACDNALLAIQAGIEANGCPSAPNADASTSWKYWPYNVDLNGGSTTTCVTDPATRQLPLLLAFGCDARLAYSTGLSSGRAAVISD